MSIRRIWEDGTDLKTGIAVCNYHEGSGQFEVYYMRNGKSVSRCIPARKHPVPNILQRDLDDTLAVADDLVLEMDKLEKEANGNAN